MDDQNPQELPMPTSADFVGSPFRLLPRVGDKMYRPARPLTDLPQKQPATGSHFLACEAPVWDWG